VIEHAVGAAEGGGGPGQQIGVEMSGRVAECAGGETDRPFAVDAGDAERVLVPGVVRPAAR
jgi:hypothetical protein